MKYFFKISIPALLVGVLIGYYLKGHFADTEIEIIQGPVIVTKRPVKKDIKKMSIIEKDAEIEIFRNAKPFLIINKDLIDPYKINAYAGYAGVEWSSSAKIKVHETGNFKFYVGLGVGVAATGATVYIGYKAYKYIKNNF